MASANEKIKRLQKFDPAAASANLVGLLEKIEDDLNALRTMFNTHVHYTTGNAGYSGATKAAYQKTTTLIDLANWAG